MPKDILSRLEEMGDLQSKSLQELEKAQDEVSLSLDKMNLALLKAQQTEKAITPETYKQIEALNKYSESLKQVIKIKKAQEAIDKKEIAQAKKGLIAAKINEIKRKSTENLEKREKYLTAVIQRRRAEDERSIALSNQITKTRQKNTLAMEAEVKAIKIVTNARQAQYKVEEQQAAVNREKVIATKLSEVQGMSVEELTKKEEKLTEALAKQESENAKRVATGKHVTKASKVAIQNIEGEIKALQLERGARKKTAKECEDQIDKCKDVTVSGAAEKDAKSEEKALKSLERQRNAEVFLAKMQGMSYAELQKGLLEVTKEIKKYERQEKQAKIIGKELDEETKEYLKTLRMKKLGYEDVIDEIKTARDELEKQASVMGIVRRQMKEGAKEVDRFSESLGENAHGALVAGAAVVYLASKVSDIGKGIQDTAKGFARYRVEATAAAKASFIAPGGLDQLEEMRNRLNLTTGQFRDYIDVLRKGANTGIISVGELVKATEQLQAAFGPDQAKRLGEYIDLLEMIPTLDTDLKVTASLDDQAAAWFALAEAGKVESVIELQAAGLLGGIEVEAERPQDVQLLESAQATEKFTEDVSQTLHSMFGAWGPKVVLAATGILTVAAYTKASLAVLGATKQFAKKIMDKPKSTPAQEETKKQQEITNIHLRHMSGQQVGNNKQLKQLSTSQKKSTEKLKAIGKQGKQQIGVFERFSRGYTRGRAGGAGRIRATARGLRGAAAGSRTLRAIGAAPGKLLGGARGLAGASATKIGTSLSSFAETIPVVGKSLATFGTQLTAAATGPFSSFPAAFSTAGGAFIGTLGAIVGVVGAAVGPFVLMAKYGKEAGEGISDFGKSLKERGGVLGDVLDSVGGALDSFGELVKKTGNYWSGAFRGMWEGLVGVSKEEQKRRKEIKKELALYKKQVKEREALAKRQKSALEMGRILKYIDSAAKNAGKKLSDLSAAIAGMELENFELAGGSIDDFRAATKQGVEGLSRSYAIQARVFDIARKKILTNSDLEIEDRHASMLKLREAELDAAKTFMNGLLGMVGQFEKIPAVVQLELQNRIRSAVLDLKLEVGAGVGEEAFTDTLAILTNDLKQLAIVTEEVPRQYDLMDKAIAGFRDKLKLDTSSVQGELSKLSEAFEKMPEGEEFIKQFSKSVDLQDVFKVKDPFRLETATKELEKAQDANKEEIKKLEPGVALYKRLSELETKRKEISETISETEKEQLEHRKEMTEGLKEISDEISAAKEWSGKSAGLVKTWLRTTPVGPLADLVGIYEKIDKSQKKINEESRKTSEQSAQEMEYMIKSEKLASKKFDLEETRKRQTQESEKLMAEIVAFGKEHVKAAKEAGLTDEQVYKLTLEDIKIKTEEKNALMKRDAAYSEALNLARKSTQYANNINVEEKKAADMVEKRARLLKSVLSGMNNIVRLIETDPTVQRMRRRVNTLEKEYELQSYLGKGGESLTKLQEARLKQVEAEREAVDRAGAALEAFTSGKATFGETIDKFVEGMGKQMEASKNKFSELRKKGAPEAGIKSAEEAAAVFEKARNVYFDKVKELKKEGKTGTEIKDATKSLEIDFMRARNGYVEAIEQLEDLPQAKQAGVDFSRLKTELQFSAGAASALTEGVEKARQEIKAMDSEIKLKTVKTFEEVVDVVSKIDASMPQRAKQATIDYNNSLLDLAAQEMKFGDINKNVGKGIESIQERFLDFQEQLDDQMLPTINRLSRQLDELKKAPVKDEAKIREVSLKLEILRGKYQEASAKNIVKKREEEVALIKKATSIRVNVLEREQSLFEEQIGYVEDIGGTFANILDLQRQSLGYEAEKLAMYEQELAALRAQGDDANAIREAEINVEKQRMALTRKALGAQRNAYEKLLGMAFGAIREARGGKKGITSRARMFGRGRVETEAGVVMAGSAGKAQTIEARSAKFMTSIEKRLGPARRFAGEKLLGGAKDKALEQEKVITEYKDNQVLAGQKELELKEKVAKIAEREVGAETKKLEATKKSETTKGVGKEQKQLTPQEKSDYESAKKFYTEGLKQGRTQEDLFGAIKEILTTNEKGSKESAERIVSLLKEEVDKSAKLVKKQEIVDKKAKEEKEYAKWSLELKEDAAKVEARMNKMRRGPAAGLAFPAAGARGAGGAGGYGIAGGMAGGGIVGATQNMFGGIMDTTQTSLGGLFDRMQTALTGALTPKVPLGGSRKTKKESMELAKSAKDMKQTADAGKQQSKTMEKASKEVVKAPTQTAAEARAVYGGRGTAGGGGVGVPDIVTNAEVTVGGEVWVHFDNKMFVDTLVNLIEKNSKVKTAINTATAARYVAKA